MTTVTKQGTSVNRLRHEYSTSWIVKNLEKLGSESLKLPEFSPISNSDVTFHLELWFQTKEKSHLLNEKASSFKMRFVKTNGSCTPQGMKMNISVSVISAVSSRINTDFEYRKNDLQAEALDIVNFPNEIFSCKDRRSQLNPPPVEEAEKHDFIIKCYLVFYNHLDSPAEYFHVKRSYENLKIFANDFNRIYKPNLLSDIEFKIGEEFFPSHKSVLSAHSPVFLKMISSDFLESKTNIITFTDCSPEIFKLFLEYLYSGEIEESTWPVLKELFRLADKYDVRTLKSDCSEIVASLLSLDNICEVLKLAYDYMDDYLKQEARMFAYKHIEELLSKDEWKELMKSNPVIGY